MGFHTLEKRDISPEKIRYGYEVLIGSDGTETARAKTARAANAQGPRRFKLRHPSQSHRDGSAIVRRGSVAHSQQGLPPELARGVELVRVMETGNFDAR